MNIAEFYVRYNAITVTSIAAFAGIAGRLNGGCKDVYFVRSIGCNTSYVRDIQEMDALQKQRQARGESAYLRLDALPKLCNADDISSLCDAYSGWNKNPNDMLNLAIIAQNEHLGQVLATALCKVRALFRHHNPNITDSIEKNFIIKLFFWIDKALTPLLENWNAEIVRKFVFTGSVKKSEYLFCYMLTLIGIDVLILSPSAPIDLEHGLLELSSVVHLGAAGDVRIPPYIADAVEPHRDASDAEPRIRVDIRRPNKGGVSIPTIAPAPRRTPAAISLSAPSERKELAFEQLAMLASSVVMIEVYDITGKAVSSGSGIMVGEAGFILTNHHVASKGVEFSVHIEDDGAVYQTDEVIKIHGLLDLALIRIERKLRPIPIYQQPEPLVRGQRVVAIGSPLGLFNSVSDGIISGFRSIDDVDMIQFTAPISAGSSGGAVLNMYGEVIGISTAGIDRGQNLNLAVGYQSILPFIRGFHK